MRRLQKGATQTVAQPSGRWPMPRGELPFTKSPFVFDAAKAQLWKVPQFAPVPSGTFSALVALKSGLRFRPRTDVQAVLGK